MKSKNVIVVLVMLLAAAVASAAVDGSILKPPPGASVAIVVFEDLECPSCAQAAPLLEQAANTYKVPLVIRDFPLRQHPWAYDAAVIARFIEDKYGRAVSDQFRDYIYEYQSQVTKGDLRSYADKFAAAHHIELPFLLDPQGKIAAAIKADQDLGTKIGLTETPTIVVVSNKDWKQVQDRSQLYTIIEQMQKEAGPAPSAKTTPTKSSTAAKRPRKKSQ